MSAMSRRTTRVTTLSAMGRCAARASALCIMCGCSPRSTALSTMRRSTARSAALGIVSGGTARTASLGIVSGWTRGTRRLLIEPRHLHLGHRQRRLPFGFLDRIVVLHVVGRFLTPRQSPARHARGWSETGRRNAEPLDGRNALGQQRQLRDSQRHGIDVGWIEPELLRIQRDTRQWRGHQFLDERCLQQFADARVHNQFRIHREVRQVDGRFARR